ncbi:MAG: FmdE family protein [Thermodesulfobacteriota bacterium]
MLKTQWSGQKVIVLTNAGHARPDGFFTQGCLDGLRESTGASRGKASLLSLNSRFDQPLWFAFYTPESGKCAYLQLDPEISRQDLASSRQSQELFAMQNIARIDAEYLFEHPDKFAEYNQEKYFGANLFRVLTAANIAALDAPGDLLQAMQPHDHYCPGVTSGVLLVRFIQKNILQGSPGADFFVLGLQPWCKEDGLQDLLNTTPGKRSYGVFYPEQEQVQNWPEDLQQTSTIVFVREKESPWQGWMLQFDFAQAREQFDGPKLENPALEKLALGIWLTEHIQEPEKFVSVVKSFELSQDMHPKDFLQPGAEVLQELSEL